MAKSALVLLDADVVIEAFRLGIWAHLVTKADIYVAATVAEEAMHYFDPATGQRRYIDLAAEVGGKRITILNGDATEMARVQAACRRHWVDLDTGELESIAIVATGSYSFCTADRAAAEAMALLDMQGRAISLEEFVRRHGIASRISMKPYYSAATMTRWLKEGGILKAQTFRTKR